MLSSSAGDFHLHPVECSAEGRWSSYEIQCCAQETLSIRLNFIIFLYYCYYYFIFIIIIIIIIIFACRFLLNQTEVSVVSKAAPLQCNIYQYNMNLILYHFIFDFVLKSFSCRLLLS